MTKMTKAEMFAQIKAHLVDPAEIAFIDHELELLAKKNASRPNKPTKNQLANVELMNRIYETMQAGKQYRVSEIGKFDFLTEYSINKVNALVRGLKLDGRVTKSEVKGIAYFTKA